MDLNESLETAALMAVSGQALLLLGAGATKDGGGVSWSELAKETASHLDSNELDSPQETLDLACSKNREKAYKFVADRLNRIEAPAELVPILNLDWPAILTTNYDQAIEKFYQHNGNKAPLVYHGDTGDDTVVLNPVGHRAILKLMGCRSIAAGSIGEMLLSEIDQERNAEYVRAMYRRVESLIGLQAIITLGYSHADEILISAAKKIRALRGNGNVQIFSLFPNDLSDSEKLRLSSYNITPIIASMGELGATIETAKGKPASDIIQVYFEGKGIPIQGRKLRDAQQRFEIVTQSEIEQGVTTSEFIRGATNNFGPHARGSVWKRSSIIEAEEHLSEWQAEPETNLSFINVSGRPGSGRHTCANALAYHLASTFEFGALRQPAGRAALDVYAATEYVGALESASGKSRANLVIITDDGSSVNECLRFLREAESSAKGKICLIRVAEDSTDANSIATSAIMAGEVTLSDGLSKDDPTQLAEYLSNLPKEMNVPEWTPEELAGIIKLNDSFLDSMYQFVNPFKKTFSEIISEELAGMGKNALQLIEACILPSIANSPVSLPTLAASLDLDYENLFSAIHEAKHLVTLTPDENHPSGCTLFHQRVGEALAMQPSKKQSAKEGLHKLIKVASLRFGADHEMVRRLIIRRQGRPGPYESHFGLVGLVDFVLLFTEEKSSRFILHHKGLTLRRADKLDEAWHVLKSAVNKNEGDPGTEPKDLVRTTLAQCEWHRYRNSAEKISLSDPEVSQLRSELESLQAGSSANSHAYTIEALMLLDIAQQTGEPQEKMRCIAHAQALANECIARGESHDEEVSKIIRTCSELGSRFSEEDAKQMELQTGHGAGWFVLSEIISDDLLAKKYRSLAIKANRPSLAAMRKTLELELQGKGANYEVAIELSDKILKILEKSGRRALWRDHMQRACALIGVGRNDGLNEHLEEAKKRSPSFLPEPVPYFIQDADARKKFEGVLDEIRNLRQAYVSQHNVGSIGGRIFVNPERSRRKQRLQKGDQVEFEIGVGIWGVTGWDVRRL